MDLDLARRLAGKLTFGERLTLVETLLLKTSTDIERAFYRLLELPPSDLSLTTAFARSYYVEPMLETHDTDHLYLSIQLFSKLQDTPMVRLLIAKAQPFNPGRQWATLLRLVRDYAPAAVVALLLEQLRSFSEIGYQRYLDDLLPALAHKDLVRFRELVELLPQDARNWAGLAKSRVGAGDFEVARVLLAKAGSSVDPNVILETAVFVGSTGFNLYYNERVLATLEELGHRPNYQQLVLVTIDKILGGSRIYEKALPLYLAHDSQRQAHLNFYLAYLESHMRGTPTKKQQLKELIEASV